MKYTQVCLIGVLSASIVCTFNQFAYVWPCAVASGAFNKVPYAIEWGLQEHHAIHMVLLAVAPVWIVAAWGFIPRSKPSSAASYRAIRFADEDVRAVTIIEE